MANTTLDLSSLRDALAALKSLNFQERNITSHTYDARQAERIVAVLGDFREDVRYLLADREKRGADAD